MASVTDSPKGRRLDFFQALALATTATTYLLILVGGIVRAEGAGLGCPDWPKCFGSWIPPTSVEDLPAGFDPSQFNAALTWTEYLNRLLGVVAGLLILATLLAAVLHHRSKPGILWPSIAAFLGVGFQGWLGGRVVAQGLAPWIVTFHLIVALVIVSLLLSATAAAFPAPHPEKRSGSPAAWLPQVLLLLTLLQVGLGTQVRSGVDAALASGTARDRALAGIGSITLAHRGLALLVLIFAGLQFSAVQKGGDGRGARRAAAWVLALASVQVILGILLGAFALPRALQVAHLSAASLLLGAETLLAILRRRAAQGPEGGRP